MAQQMLQSGEISLHLHSIHMRLNMSYKTES